MYGAQSSSLHAVELAARKAEAAARGASTDDAALKALEFLLDNDVCIAGAVALIGKSRQWIYHAGKEAIESSGATTEAAGDQATEETGEPSGTTSRKSRHPTIEAKRALEELPSVQSVLADTCMCGERCGNGITKESVTALRTSWRLAGTKKKQDLLCATAHPAPRPSPRLPCTSLCRTSDRPAHLAARARRRHRCDRPLTSARFPCAGWRLCCGTPSTARCTPSETRSSARSSA